MTVDRRSFLDLTAGASALAIAGHLPVLAGEARGKDRKGARRGGSAAAKTNIFTEPPAIEPVTGYLRTFRPAAGAGRVGAPDSTSGVLMRRGGMRSGDFTAAYRVVCWRGVHPATGRARNLVAGALTVRRRGGDGEAVYEISERRQGQSTGEWRARLTCGGELDALVRWTFTSEVGPRSGGPPGADLTFTEEGRCRDGVVEQSTGLSKVVHRGKGPLLAQWSLLHILALGPGRYARLRRGPTNGPAKGTSLRFDMLADCSVYKPGQALRYGGKIEVPTAAGNVRLDCYAQTGYGILPIHYLVDEAGRVQLITQADTNWALQSVK